MDAGHIFGVDLDDIRDQRWFAAKHERGQRLVIVDEARVPGGGPRLVVADVVSSSGNTDRYLLIMEVGSNREPRIGDGRFAALTRWILDRSPVKGARGGSFVPAVEPGVQLGLPQGERFVGDDQSNTIVGVGDRWLLKCYRRIHAGVHPEPELLGALVDLPSTPRLGATVIFDDGSALYTALVLVERIPDVETGWAGPIARLAEVLDRPAEVEALERAAAEYAVFASAVGGLHEELRSRFSARAVLPEDLNRWHRSARADLQLAQQITTGPANSMLAKHRPRLERALAFDSGAGHRLQRIHGDLHLGQFLRRTDKVWIIDFEGDPQAGFEERRRLDSPLLDLACLLRSLDHLLSATITRRPERRIGDAPQAWRSRTREAVIATYEQDQGPVDRILLRAFETHRELREFVYAATVLPEWMHAPMFGIDALFEWPD